jgi:hypothetical protein
MIGVRWQADNSGLERLARQMPARRDAAVKETLGEIALTAAGLAPVQFGALSDSYYTATSDGASNYGERWAAARADRPEAPEAGEEPPPAVPDGIGGVVGSAVAYASPVEDGHVSRGGGFVAPRPHLAPAVAQHTVDLADRLAAAQWQE